MLRHFTCSPDLMVESTNWMVGLCSHLYFDLLLIPDFIFNFFFQIAMTYFYISTFHNVCDRKTIRLPPPYGITGLRRNVRTVSCRGNWLAVTSPFYTVCSRPLCYFSKLSPPLCMMWPKNCIILWQRRDEWRRNARFSLSLLICSYRNPGRSFLTTSANTHHEGIYSLC